MAHPKRKFSKARTRKKRAAKLHLDVPSTSACPQCKRPKLPHRICVSCGYYDGRQVLTIKKKEKKKKKGQ